VRLTIIGCSPAWPNPGSAQSGYLVEGEGRLLLDCGPGVLARLRERESWPHIDAVAITHLHLDHVGDLVAWHWGHLMGPGRDAPSPELWLPPHGREGLAPLAGNLDDAFVVREYAPGETFTAAGFSVTPVALEHGSHAAFGLRVSDGARVLAYSGDTGPTPALAELARGADLFLCEATFATPDEGHMHLTAADALAAADGARLVLTHRPVELPAPDGMAVAYDGLELDI
jgi:ribonuclease BN (tRNA processing enzyme)